MRCALCPCATTFDHNLGYSLLYYVIPQGRISYSKCYKTYDRMHLFLSEIFNIGEQKNWSMFALDAILSSRCLVVTLFPRCPISWDAEKCFIFSFLEEKNLAWKALVREMALTLLLVLKCLLLLDTYELSSLSSTTFPINPQNRAVQVLLVWSSAMISAESDESYEGCILT